MEIIKRYSLSEIDSLRCVNTFTKVSWLHIGKKFIIRAIAMVSRRYHHCGYRLMRSELLRSSLIRTYLDR
jgi:hypothetical protein